MVMTGERLYSIRIVARELNCKPDDVIQLINNGTLNADACSTGICIVISEEEVEKARQALKDKGDKE